MSTLPSQNSSLETCLTNNVTFQNLLNNPLMLKDVWSTVDDLGININQHNKVLTLTFKSVQQSWLKSLMKLHILVGSKRKLSGAYLRNCIYSINLFSKFIAQKYIFSYSQINEQLFDEFDYYLCSLKLSSKTKQHHYNALKNLFNFCREEGWLDINTYWFNGKCKTLAPKNDEIEYIPEEVWQQLDKHLHHLPDPLQRMVIVIRSTGLRIGELLNLPFDCLRQRGVQWRLRFQTEKYQTIDEIPICEELVIVIKEQQEYIKHHFEDSYHNLFGTNKEGHYKRYTPSPKIMNISTLNSWLNKLAKEQKICSNNGEVWHFKSHQFRRTIATVMTNAGARDLIIMYILRHRSSSMTRHYTHLLKKVLGEEYAEIMKEINYVNGSGKLVAIYQPQNILTEALRRKMYPIDLLRKCFSYPLIPTISSIFN